MLYTNAVPVPPDAAAELLDRLQASRAHGPELRREAMLELSRLEGYSWCGVYILEGAELVLDAFVGAETEHRRIPVGRGVCGVAVSTGRNQVVRDVRDLDNYLACSLETRSEIVVLIREGESILGQIDVDGHEVGAFASEDESLLEEIAELLAARWRPATTSGRLEA